MANRPELTVGFGAGMLHSPDRLKILSRLAEDARFDVVWVGDPPMRYDPFVQVANAVQHTRGIRVGLAVTNPYTRSVVKTWLGVAQLDKAASGRLVFAWGAGSLEGIRALGYDWDRPVIHIREAFQVGRRLLAGETVDFEGETLRLRRVRIDFPLERAYIPTYMGCRRKYMLRLAGEVADGVLVDYPTVPRFKWAVRQLKRGARRGSRALTTRNFGFGALLPFSVRRESARAKAQIKRVLPITFISITPEELEITGITQEQITPVQRVMAKGGLDALKKASALVTDEMVDMFGVAGTPDECLDRIQEYQKVGLNELSLNPPPRPEDYPEASIQLAKEYILPQLRGE